MVIDEMLLKDLYSESGEEIIAKAERLAQEKRVRITKVLYDNKLNFEISSIVTGYKHEHDVFIKVKNGEIENLRCTCAEYEDNYCACKHIIAAMKEFSSNSKYISSTKKSENIISENNKRNKSNNRIFKQLINEFYFDIENEKEKNETEDITHSDDIKIVPKLIYNEQNQTLKLEARIGTKTLYKIKSFPEFFDRMMKEEVYKYGANLNFKHTKEVFAKEDQELLEFLLKYGEIIKYANESSNNYGYYARALSDSYILLSNTGLDELFEILKGKSIEFQNQNDESDIWFINNEADIQFILKENKEEYTLEPNIDIYSYNVFYGKEYIYILIEEKLYKCSKNRQKDILQILEIFKKNFTQEIKFSESDLHTFFSIVYPLSKKYINLNDLRIDDIEKYVPKDLYVKVYLDYDKNNYITADIKFCYGNEEFNPLEENNLEIPRDALKESESLDLFIKSGFMLDSANARLILANEDSIYNFLTNDIEEYMQSFEVLVTDSFKQKEVKQPKITSIGVRIENNLLNIDFTKLDFDPKELIEIMKKYKLKKNFYRLKDGSFIDLKNSEDLDFLNDITENLDIDYKELDKGTIQLPVYRTLYLDKLIGNLKGVKITKDDNYKKIVGNLDLEQISDEIETPKRIECKFKRISKTRI